MIIRNEQKRKRDLLSAELGLLLNSIILCGCVAWNVGVTWGVASIAFVWSLWCIAKWKAVHDNG